MSVISVIIYGPKASGKTSNRDALKKHFGCSLVVDDWCPREPLIKGALHLTNEYSDRWPRHARVFLIEEALASLQADRP